MYDYLFYQAEIIMFKICFYVPFEYKEAVKSAMFAAGAGKIGKYQNCSWEVEGQGQFTGMQEAKPFINTTGEITTFREIKVEMICTEDVAQAVKQALIDAHPYETPAYQFMQILEI